MGAKQKWINPRLHIFEKKISPAFFGVKAKLLNSFKNNYFLSKHYATTLPDVNLLTRLF